MNPLFLDKSTNQALDYRAYNQAYGINEWFGVEIAPDAVLNDKIVKKEHVSVDPDYQVPFAPEIDDLIRLHFLCLNRRVTTVLEFGVGKSTRVFADALRINRERHGEYVAKHLRRADPFRLFSTDNSPEWVDHCRPPSTAESVPPTPNYPTFAPT